MLIICIRILTLSERAGKYVRKQPAKIHFFPYTAKLFFTPREISALSLAE